MKLDLLPSVLILIFLIGTRASSHEFRLPEEPGFRLSDTNKSTDQVSEDWDFFDCASRETLKLEYVEACAIFKDKEKRYLECRYQTETYRQVPSEQLTLDGDNVISICSGEAYKVSESRFLNFFKNVWTQIFE